MNNEEIPKIDTAGIEQVFNNAEFRAKINNEDKSYYIRVKSKGYFPKKKIQNAINKYAKSVNINDVLVFYDDTLLGSGTDGFCVTKDTFYYKEMLESPGFFDIHEIAKVNFDGKKIFVDTIKGRHSFNFSSLDNKELALSIEKIAEHNAKYINIDEFEEELESFGDFDELQKRIQDSKKRMQDSMKGLIHTQWSMFKKVLDMNDNNGMFSEDYVRANPGQKETCYESIQNIDGILSNLNELGIHGELYEEINGYKVKLLDVLRRTDWVEISLQNMQFRAFGDIVCFQGRWFIGAYAEPNSIYYSDDLKNWHPLDIGEKLEFFHFAVLNNRLFFFNEPSSKNLDEKYDCTIHEIMHDTSCKKINVDFLVKKYNCLMFKSFMYHNEKYVLFSEYACPFTDEDGNEDNYSPAVIAVTDDFEHWSTYSTSEHFPLYSVQCRPLINDNGNIFLHANYKTFGNMIGLVSEDCLHWKKYSEGDYEKHILIQYQNEVLSQYSSQFNFTSPFPKEMYCFDIMLEFKSFSNGNIQVWHHFGNIILIDTQENQAKRILRPINIFDYAFTYTDNKLIISDGHSLYIR